MESVKVKKLREKHGIHDTRNEYTEDEIIKLSQQKLYYIIPSEKGNTKDIYIQFKQVLGYVSTDEKACIFIKDKEITGDDRYIPMIQISKCKEIKEGVYHDRINNMVYCITEDLQFCLNYMKKCVEQEIQEKIKELEEEIATLKNTNIITN